MNAVRSELTKLTTLRLTWALLGVAVVISGAIGGGNVYVFGEDSRLELSAVAIAPVEVAWFLVVVVAVLAAASEFQYRSVLTTLLTTPGRDVVLVSKAAAAALFGAIMTVASMTTALIAGIATAAFTDVALSPGPAVDWVAATGAVVLGGLWAVFASALGLLTRSTALALTALLMWKFVLEGIVPVVTRNPGLSDWTPGGAASAVIHPGGPGLSAALAVLVVLGYAVAMCALAAATFLTRDPV
jgi:ABC-2 type transport system permease protein